MFSSESADFFQIYQVYKIDKVNKVYQIYKIYKISKQVCPIYNFGNGCHALGLEEMRSLQKSKYKINWIPNINTNESVQTQIDHGTTEKQFLFFG